MTYMYGKEAAEAINNWKCPRLYSRERRLARVWSWNLSRQWRNLPPPTITRRWAYPDLAQSLALETLANQEKTDD